jgi:NDP-sugar pyrophosphorylase family protein
VKAVILAGGRGTRLAPYTTSLPKPLVPVGDRPIIDIIVHQLQSQGIVNITLAVGHLAELFIAHFGDGSRFGVRIEYSREQAPLGTAGPLGLVAGLSERFVVMNGDVLTDLDVRVMAARHAASGAVCTVAACPREVAIDLGVVEFDAANRLTAYREKPVHRYRASMGVYVMEPRVLDFVAPNTVLDLPDLMTRLVDAGEMVMVHPFDGYWLDIGSPPDYAKAVADLRDGRPLLSPDS